MMSSSHSLKPHAAEFENRAHLEAVEHFAEHLKQFRISCDHVARLERDIAKLALAAMTASRRPPGGQPIQTDDGGQWHKSVALYDSVFICHRQALNGMEFAVTELFPSGSNEIWITGRNAVEVVKAFAHDLRHALQIWTEDIQTQVKEFLASRYPGQDLSRVSDGFVRRLGRD